jgi:hypothetical protein
MILSVRYVTVYISTTALLLNTVIYKCVVIVHVLAFFLAVFKEVLDKEECSHG